jgi:hypothetical protein
LAKPRYGPYLQVLKTFGAMNPEALTVGLMGSAFKRARYESVCVGSLLKK